MQTAHVLKGFSVQCQMEKLEQEWLIRYVFEIIRYRFHFRDLEGISSGASKFAILQVKLVGEHEPELLLRLLFILTDCCYFGSDDGYPFSHRSKEHESS